MGYDEYIKDLGHEDLCRLIAHCEQKKALISQQGKIPLYIVSDDCLNHFANTDETVAKEWLKSVIKLLLEKDDFERAKEFSILKQMVYKSELDGWSVGFDGTPEDCVRFY